MSREAAKVVEIIKSSKHRNLILYYFFPGLCVGFYATFLYKLIGLSLPQKSDETVDDYNKRVSFYSGLVFISLGVSQALTGLLLNRFGERLCKFKAAATITLYVEIAGFVSLLCYFLREYWLCFFVAFLWGSAETFIQTNTGALIGIVFPGKVEAFSAYRIVFAVGTTTTIVLNIALKSLEPWVFLTIVMMVQVITSYLANRIIDLRPQNQ